MTQPELAVHRYVPTGAATGPPMLLVHGFASDGFSDWVASDWPATLTAAGRVVLVVDLPGHGSSAAPRDRAEVLPSVLVRSLAEIVEAESEPRVDVVGYSLGARLAWDLPGTAGVEISHLVLGGISPGEPFAMVDTALIRKCVDNGQTPDDPLHAAIMSMVTSHGQDSRALLTCVDGLGAEAFDPRPGQVGVPTLLVAGEDDPMTEGIAGLAAMIDGAELTRVPGDHGGALHSAEFCQATAAFIGAT